MPTAGVSRIQAQDTERTAPIMERAAKWGTGGALDAQPHVPRWVCRASRKAGSGMEGVGEASHSVQMVKPVHYIKSNPIANVMNVKPKAICSKGFHLVTCNLELVLFHF